MEGDNTAAAAAAAVEYVGRSLVTGRQAATEVN